LNYIVIIFNFCCTDYTPSALLDEDVGVEVDRAEQRDTRRSLQPFSIPLAKLVGCHSDFEHISTPLPSL
jgi:hypothetical protein